LDEALLARVEDAGLNASAPLEQRWMDGWLVRYSKGKARRARCINAVAAGRLPLADKLQRCAALYRDAGLPLVFRITPFSQPPALDAELAALGLAALDDTRVMVNTALPAGPAPALPPGVCWLPLPAPAYAEAVGQLRGSPESQRLAHAQRLASSPVPYHGYAIERDGEVLACGQFTQEAELAGLYDVFTRERERGKGWARLLCQRLLSLAASQGAKVGYLQVEADNAPARQVYARLGFADGYAYHYRQRPGD